jgi:alpha-tubulin suppressor-like RCC1 family protein
MCPCYLRRTPGLLLALVLGSVSCQPDRVTGPRPDFATAAATYQYGFGGAGMSHSCLSRAPVGTGNHTLLCWGRNFQGQLGIGSFASPRLTPTAVQNNTGSALWYTTGGSDHHCALSSVGRRAYCWGWNLQGQLGDGTTTNRNVPTLVQGGHQWTQITTGRTHTCAVNDIGVAYCWGDGANGRLGHGGTANKPIPTPVSTAVTFSELEAGENFTCGRTKSYPSSIFCWGANNYGQLGNGTFTQLLKPGVGVYGGPKWHDLTLGNLFACATADGGVGGAPNWCWGYNYRGQLGNGQTTSWYNTPQAVSTPAGVRLHPISAGMEFACGRRVDTSQMYCWGKGDQGELGNGFFVDRRIPYPVYGGLTVSPQPFNMLTGWHHVVVVRSDNTVVAWGHNADGQLGDGTTLTRDRPVVILGP